MKKREAQRGEIKLVGIRARTINSAEMNPETAVIGKTIHKFCTEGLAQGIQNRVQPGVYYSVYTNYEGDENDYYTYFFGEQVDEFSAIPEHLETLTIPAQEYATFEVGPGKMPDICIAAWQKIWTLNADDFGGARSYIADFEIYDERSRNPEDCIFDIYIGIKK